MTRPYLRVASTCLLASLAAGCAATTSGAAAPRTVQPGAPGEPTRVVEAGEAALGRPGATAADARFVEGMLAHHAQALAMTALAAEHTRSADLLLLAERIEVSQRDEIRRMRGWMRAHGEDAPGLEELLEQGHAHHGMPGMLSPDEMAALAAAHGPPFDRLFLELMIRHHRGALVMVEELLASPGAAQEPVLYQLASDVMADQTAEIQRMRALLDRR